MSILHFQYRRSSKLLDDIFIQTGERAESYKSLAVEMTEQTPELRARVLRVLGQPAVLSNSRDGYILYEPKPRIITSSSISHKPELVLWGNQMVLDQDLTVDDLPALLDRIESGLGDLPALKAELATKVAEWEEVQAKRQAEQEAEKERQARIQADMEAAKRRKAEEREQEKRAWVAAHGSDYLKRAIAAGYDCQKRYVLERAAVEHPGAVVDWENVANWKSRSCPSEAALDLAEKVGGIVVWLTNPPAVSRATADEYADEYADEFEPCEAVVLRDYLGKYDLIYVL